MESGCYVRNGIPVCLARPVLYLHMPIQMGAMDGMSLLVSSGFRQRRHLRITTSCLSFRLFEIYRLSIWCMGLFGDEHFLGHLLDNRNVVVVMEISSCQMD